MWKIEWGKVCHYQTTNFLILRVFSCYLVGMTSFPLPNFTMFNFPFWLPVRLHLHNQQRKKWKHFYGSPLQSHAFYIELANSFLADLIFHKISWLYVTNRVFFLYIVQISSACCGNNVLNCFEIKKLKLLKSYKGCIIKNSNYATAILY